MPDAVRHGEVDRELATADDPKPARNVVRHGEFVREEPSGEPPTVIQHAPDPERDQEDEPPEPETKGKTSGEKMTGPEHDKMDRPTHDKGR